MVTSINSLTPGDDNIQTIFGTVVSVQEDEFILSDETGEILVDAYDWLEQSGSSDTELDLAVGDRLTVVGDLDDDDFDARRIIRSDGSEELSSLSDSPGELVGKSSSGEAAQLNQLEDNVLFGSAQVGGKSTMVTSINSLTPGDDNIQTIFGTVVSVRDDEFILSDETGEILVDAYEWLEQPGSSDTELDLAIGEQLIVVGELDDDDFDALRITASNKSVVCKERVLEEATLLGSNNDQFVQETNDTVIVNGEAGNDSLTGAKGSDFLIGGAGNDLLTGGDGYDTFIVGQGADAIADFGSSDIIVDLSDSFDDIEAILGSGGAATQVGQDTVIDLGDDNSVTLVKFAVEDLTAANFDLGDL